MANNWGHESLFTPPLICLKKNPELHFSWDGGSISQLTATPRLTIESCTYKATTTHRHRKEVRKWNVGLILRTSNKFICISCIERELREQGVCRVPLTLGKALKSLNKGFAECHPRQTWHNNQSEGKELSTDCYFLGIRQRLCRLLSWLLTKKSRGKGGQVTVTEALPSAVMAWHSAKSQCFCRV